jgi:hypothetical protein
MPLLNSGRDHIAKTIIGESVTAFNNANAYIAVGNSNTAFSASQTDLQGASKYRKAVDASYPQRTNNVLTYRATFSTSEANFDWEEWGIANDPTSGTLLNRKVESLGTKNSYQTWQFTVDITVVAG